MSTKVYDAYKVKRRDQLWPLLREIQKRGVANVTQKLKALYWKQMVFLDTESEEYKKAEALYKSDWAARLMIVRDHLRKKFKENATSMGRDFYDIDVSIAVYEHSSGFYIRTFCDNVSCLKGSLDFVAKHPKLRDFHYQNSSDRPAKVSEREWATRRRIWNEIMEEGHSLRAIAIVPVCNWMTYWTIDPHLDLADGYRKKPPVFPSPEEAYAEKLRKIPELGDVTAQPGLITAKDVTLKKGKKVWTSTFEGAKKRHPTLKGAVEHIRFQFLPEAFKESVQRMMDNAKRKRRQEKRKSKAVHV